MANTLAALAAFTGAGLVVVFLGDIAGTIAGVFERVSEWYSARYERRVRIAYDRARGTHNPERGSDDD